MDILWLSLTTKRSLHLDADDEVTHPQIQPFAFNFLMPLEMIHLAVHSWGLPLKAKHGSRDWAKPRCTRTALSLGSATSSFKRHCRSATMFQPKRWLNWSGLIGSDSKGACPRRRPSRELCHRSCSPGVLFRAVWCLRHAGGYESH